MQMFDFISGQYHHATRPREGPQFIYPTSDTESILDAFYSYHIISTLQYHSEYSKLLNYNYLLAHHIPYISMNNTEYYKVMVDMLRIAINTWTSAKYFADHNIIDPKYSRRIPTVRRTRLITLTVVGLGCCQCPSQNDWDIGNIPITRLYDCRKMNWRKLEIERLRALVAFLKEVSSVRRKRMAELPDLSPPPPAPQLI